MKITQRINSKLSTPIPDRDADGHIIPRLYWIMVGIGSGEITGSERELRTLICLHLANLADMEFVRAFADTSISGKLLSHSESISSSSDIYLCIICALRLFFEKNPLALIKSIPLRGEEMEMTMSAFTKIGESIKFQDGLYPELSAFIRDNVSKLNESQLLLIAHALHNNQVLIQQLMDALVLTDGSVLLELTRDALPEDILEDAIRHNWHPEHSRDVNYFYANFPKIEMWRLFMDGAQQDVGWASYDSREPGCINQLYQAWLFLQKTHDCPLTAEFLKNIHAISSKNILPEPWSTGYRDYQPSYNMSSNSITFLGYLYQIRQLGEFCWLEKNTGGISFTGHSNISTHYLNETIQSIIKEYESNTSVNKNNPRSLLKDIILLCKKLVLIHPFKDCNGRLFCNLLLNRELIQHGFSPALLDNPNRFDGWSPDELLSEVTRGMINFQTLKHCSVFKKGSTFEFLKTQIYPIPDIMEVLKRPASAIAGAIVEHSFFSSTTSVREGSFIENVRLKVTPQDISSEARDPLQWHGF